MMALRALLAGVPLVLAASLASAARPLDTEDAAALPAKSCEMEMFGARVRHADDNLSGLNFGCGIGADTQLALSYGRDAAAGLAGLAGKTALPELSSQTSQFAIVYLATFMVRPAQEKHYQSSEVKVVMTSNTQGWLMQANTGWFRTEADDAERLTWNMAAERPNALRDIDLMLEVFGEGSSTPRLQTGARWTVVPERVALDAAWALQANRARDARLSLGMKVAF